ncbi:MAG: hypothetical protein PHT54_03270 [Candidatus Nanoarchaeia archaeon]|nr:hypothetical protein [Candidatus Nanoarchaeia archaeon]
MQTEKTKTPQKKEEYLEYLCRNCRYQFKRKKSISVVCCPYCGKKTIEERGFNSAQKLLDESSERMFPS